MVARALCLRAGAFAGEDARGCGSRPSYAFHASGAVADLARPLPDWGSVSRALAGRGSKTLDAYRRGANGPVFAQTGGSLLRRVRTRQPAAGRLG
jgi:hypothetical protein